MSTSFTIKNIKHNQYRHIGIHAERSGFKPANNHIDESYTNYNIHLANNYHQFVNDSGLSKKQVSQQIGIENKVIERHFGSDLDRINNNRKKHSQKTFDDVFDYVQNAGKGKAESSVIATFGESTEILKIRDELMDKAIKNGKAKNEDDFDRKFSQACSQGLANYCKGFNRRNKYVTLVNAVTNVDEHKIKEEYGAPHVHMQLVHTGYNKYDQNGNPAKNAHPDLSLDNALKGQFPEVPQSYLDKVQKDNPKISKKQAMNKARMAMFNEQESQAVIKAVGKELNKDLGYRYHWQKADLKDQKISLNMADYKKAKQAGIDVSKLSEEMTDIVPQLTSENQALKKDNKRLRQSNKMLKKGREEDMAQMTKYKAQNEELDKFKKRYEKADNRNKDLAKKNKSLQQQIIDLQTQLDQQKKANEKQAKKLDKQDLKIKEQSYSLNDFDASLDASEQHQKQRDEMFQTIFDSMGINIDVTDDKALSDLSDKAEFNIRNGIVGTPQTKQTQKQAEKHVEKQAQTQTKQFNQAKRPQRQAQTHDIPTPDSVSLFEHYTAQQALAELKNMFQMYCAQFATHVKNVMFKTPIDEDLLFSNKPVTFDLNGKKQQMDPEFAHNFGNATLYGLDSDSQSSYWARNMPQGQQSQWQYDDQQSGNNLTWAQVLQEELEYGHVESKHNTHGIGASIKSINDKLKEKVHEHALKKLKKADPIKGINVEYDTGVDTDNIYQTQTFNLDTYKNLTNVATEPYQAAFEEFGLQHTGLEKDFFNRANAHPKDQEMLNEYCDDYDTVKNVVSNYVKKYNLQGHDGYTADTYLQDCRVKGIEPDPNVKPDPMAQQGLFKATREYEAENPLPTPQKHIKKRAKSYDDDLEY